MQKKASSLLDRPWLIFVGLFGILCALDIWLGPENYIPTWNAHIWFAEVCALILTAVWLGAARKFSLKTLPWFLAGLTVLVFSLSVYSNRATEANSTVYDTLLGRPYYVLEHVIPYYTPFHQPGHDHLLFGDDTEMLQTQVFMVVPLAIGYAIYFAQQSHRKSPRLKK